MHFSRRKAFFETCLVSGFLGSSNLKTFKVRLMVKMFGSCFFVACKKNVQNLHSYLKRDIWGAEGQMLAENEPSEKIRSVVRCIFLLFVILCSVACRYWYENISVSFWKYEMPDSLSHFIAQRLHILRHKAVCENHA